MPHRRAATVIAVVLAVVFFASTVVLAIAAAGLKADKDELIDGRAEVASTAGRFVEALLSYDHRDAEGFRTSVLAYTAPPFTGQFEVAVVQLQEQFEGLEAVSQPTIKDVFVTEVADGAADAIVVYDRVVDGTGGPRRETNMYVRLGLIETGGGWRVNDVTNLTLAMHNAGEQTATDSAPTGSG